MTDFLPRLIFWESTKRCNLECIHCRALPTKEKLSGELNTKQIKNFIEDVASWANPALPSPLTSVCRKGGAKPILILSGGEALLREDIFDVAGFAGNMGLTVALASNATLITPETAGKIKKSGIKRVSVSLDGANAKTHDVFRGVKGAFQKAIEGINNLKKEGLSLQINTTVTKRNIKRLKDVLKLVLELKADAWHIFLLVPVGCGLEVAAKEQITPQEYEEVLKWFYKKSKETKIQMKATCAPHYLRIIYQKAKEEGVKPMLHSQGMSAVTKGCLAGSEVCFISWEGDIFPCGYLPIKAGNIKENSFKDIWFNNYVLETLRNPKNLKGKCSICEYVFVCAGCRARAYGHSGDYLAEEPYCIYEPKGMRA